MKLKNGGEIRLISRRLFINPREKAVAEPVAIHHNQSCHDPLSRSGPPHWSTPAGKGYRPIGPSLRFELPFGPEGIIRQNWTCR